MDHDGPPERMSATEEEGEGAEGAGAACLVERKAVDAAAGDARLGARPEGCGRVASRRAWRQLLHRDMACAGDSELRVCAVAD